MKSKQKLMFVKICFSFFTMPFAGNLNSGKLTPVKPEFSIYCKEQTPIFVVKYPFLTSTQIKGKIKAIWDKLSPSEKTKYVPFTLPQ